MRSLESKRRMKEVTRIGANTAIDLGICVPGTASVTLERLSCVVIFVKSSYLKRINLLLGNKVNHCRTTQRQILWIVHGLIGVVYCSTAVFV